MLQASPEEDNIRVYLRIKPTDVPVEVSDDTVQLGNSAFTFDKILQSQVLRKKLTIGIRISAHEGDL